MFNAINTNAISNSNNIANDNRAPVVQRLHATVFPELKRLGFKADFEPVYMRNHIGGNATPIDTRLGRVIRRQDTGEALGIVGKAYGLAQNPELYSMVCNAAEDALPAYALQGLELTEHSSYSGAYSRFELTFPALGADIRQLSGSKTQLKFRVGVSNSFNGSGAVRVFAGAYDLVCTNGMVVGECEKHSARHSSGFTPLVFADFIRLEMAKYLERVHVWQAWANARITPAQAEELLNSAGMAGRKVSRMMEQFELESAKRGRSVWALYSALTYYSSHNSEAFTVRNSANVDNVAISLDQREREVSKIIDSPEWQALAA
jgi:hypothetical protein